MLPVPPYGLERIRTAAAAAGADVELLDPYLTSDEPHAAAARRAAELQPQVIGLGLRVLEDCIPIDDLDGAAPHDVHNVIAEVRGLVDALRDGGAGRGARARRRRLLGLPRRVPVGARRPVRHRRRRRGPVRLAARAARHGARAERRARPGAPRPGGRGGRLADRVRRPDAARDDVRADARLPRPHPHRLRDGVRLLHRQRDGAAATRTATCATSWPRWRRWSSSGARAASTRCRSSSRTTSSTCRARSTPSRCCRRSWTPGSAGTWSGGRTSTRRRSPSASPSSPAPPRGSSPSPPTAPRTTSWRAPASRSAAGTWTSCCERTAAYGVRTELGLIFGLPGETRGRPLAETIAFVRGPAARRRGRLRRRRPRVPEHAARPHRGAGAAAPLRRARPAGGGADRLLGRRRAARAGPAAGAGVRRPAARRAHGRGVRTLDAGALARVPRGAGRRPRRRGAVRSTGRRGSRGRRPPARSPPACASPSGTSASTSPAAAVARLRRADLPPDVSGAGLLRARVVLGAMGRAQGLRRRLRTSSSRA